MNETFKGVFAKGKDFYTRNIVPCTSVYGEALVKEGKAEFRQWNPNKSKLCASLHKRISQIGIKPGMAVLYLGSSTGTTVSHVSDIVDPGFVFALDSSPRVMRDLVHLCERRSNIAPVLADARHPERYAHRISRVDALYQDVSQKNQVEIFKKNADMFLKPGGFGVLCIKARSIDVTKSPKAIFSQVRKELEIFITLVDYRELDPFQKDHIIFVCKKSP